MTIDLAIELFKSGGEIKSYTVNAILEYFARNPRFGELLDTVSNFFDDDNANVALIRAINSGSLHVVATLLSPLSRIPSDPLHIPEKKRRELLNLLRHDVGKPFFLKNIVFFRRPLGRWPPR